MRMHILDYVRCAQCKRTAPREDRGEWLELTICESFFGLFDLPTRKKNICPDCTPSLGWPHAPGSTQ